jgi:superfamily I DNA and/or RNA helicase
LVGLSRSHNPLLTTGFASDDLKVRMATLDHQHRMHPFISALPRKIFYAGRELLDSDTVTQPSRETRWGFKLKTPGAKRRHWINISGAEGSPLKSEEQVREEIDVTLKILAHFKDWAANNPPPPNRDGVQEPWEVACLSFYVKPYNLLKEALQRTFGPAKKGLFLATNMQVNVATVDRFQGHEADLVILMMRRNGHGAKRSEGFLDIPNRVNVAITRAREQLVILGDQHFFLGDDRTEHLRELAQNS